MNTPPTVSICMITYNHEAYIAEAIEGVLMQKTNFPIKLIIGEDCSTDNTRFICEKYANNFPEQIELLPSNIKLGMSKNFLRTLKACTGKYIAICEGDDYWINSNKLAFQVNFLDKRKEYVLSCHNYWIKKDSNDLTKGLDTFLDEQFEINLQFFFNQWVTKTLSVVFRSDALDFQKFDKFLLFRDVHLIYHLLENKTGIFNNFYGGVYRIHKGGTYSTLTCEKQRKTSIAVYSELYSHKKTTSLKMQYVSSMNHFLNHFIKDNNAPIFKNEFWQYLLTICRLGYIRLAVKTCIRAILNIS